MVENSKQLSDLAGDTFVLCELGTPPQAHSSMKPPPDKAPDSKDDTNSNGLVSKYLF